MKKSQQRGLFFMAFFEKVLRTSPEKNLGV